MPQTPTSRNRLDEEASPYLEQHADNPVNWQPWDETALDVARELDAVERFYPYGRPVDDARVERVAAESDLLLTGGSDAHERTLAEAGLTASAFEPVRERLPSPTGAGPESSPIDEQD